MACAAHGFKANFFFLTAVVVRVYAFMYATSELSPLYLLLLVPVVVVVVQ